MADLSAATADRLRRIRDRHFDCYLDLAQAAHGANGEGDWAGIVDAELANLRSALEWGFVSARPETAALATALEWYWADRRLFVEGRGAIDRALRDPDLSRIERIDALLAAGSLADKHGDRPAAQAHYEMARQLAAAAGDAGRQAQAAGLLGWMLYFMDLPAQAREAFREALDLGEGLSVSRRADALRGLGWARAVDEGGGVAMELHRDARELLEAAEDPELPSHYLVETNLLVTSGRPKEGLALADRAVAFARRGIGPLTWALEARANAARALGDWPLLRRTIEEGIEAARAAGSEGGTGDFVGARGWEGNFQHRLAQDAIAHGEIDLARDALDGGLRALDDVVLNVHDAGIRARLLGTRARIAQDDGDFDLAHELHRQAISLHGRYSVSYEAQAVVDLSEFLAEHGEFEAGRLAAIQALALADRTDSKRFYRQIELDIISDDIEAGLRHTAEGLAVMASDYGLLRRRYALLAELGRLDEAAAVIDGVIASVRDGDLSRTDRARIRIARGDAAGARADLLQIKNAAEVGWAITKLYLGTTFARLALLEGRRDRAVEIWSAVVAYRTANRRVATRLFRRFEEPLRELKLGVAPRELDSRAALDALRSLVSEEFAALATQERSQPPSA